MVLMLVSAAQWCLWAGRVAGRGKTQFNDKREGLLSQVVVFLCQNSEFHDWVKQNGECH